MSQSSTEPRMDDFFTALTDSIIAGDNSLDSVLQQYNMPRPQVEAAIAIIRHLHSALTGVQPSRRFVRRLRADLVGSPASSNLIDRVRHLPPRVQIAAGVMFVAGFMLLRHRRLVSDTQTESVEPAVMAQ